MQYCIFSKLKAFWKIHKFTENDVFLTIIKKRVSFNASVYSAKICKFLLSNVCAKSIGLDGVVLIVPDYSDRSAIRNSIDASLVFVGKVIFEVRCCSCGDLVRKRVNSGRRALNQNAQF